MDEGKFTKFLEACRDGKMEEVERTTSAKNKKELEQLLSQRGTICVGDTEKNLTPLCAAAGEGHEACVAHLLGAGASVSAVGEYGRTPLGAYINTPLHLAALNGHEACVAHLLGAGASVSAVGENGNTPLHLAAGGGHEACVAHLLGAGASVSAVGKYARTPLHMAADGGHEACVAHLLDAGASVSVVDDDGRFRSRSAHGSTPLHLAAFNGHEACVAHLLDAGASVSVLDEYGTPLFSAAFNGHEACIAHLLGAGASVSVANEDGIHEAKTFSNKTRLLYLLAECESSAPCLTDVDFSKESRVVMDSLRDSLQQFDHPILLLCSLQAGFHRRARLRPMVSNDMEGFCGKVKQLIDAALGISAMDDPTTFLKAWGCESSRELVNHPVVNKIMENNLISLFATPQLQHHFHQTFYKRRDKEDPFKWLAQDWRTSPACFIFAEFLFYCLFFALTLSVVWSGSGELSFQLRDATHLLLLVMTVGYSLEELVQLRSDGSSYFLNDSWNFLDLIFIITFFGWAITSKVQILSLNLFVLPFRLMHFLSFFQRIGSFVTVLLRMIFDTLLFLVSFSIILIGYSLMCSSMLYNVEGFGSLQSSILTLFAASLGDFDFSAFQNEDTMSYEWGGVILLSIFLLLAMVMALNMLIAILSDTYSKLAEHTHEEWCLIFGGMVLDSLVKEQWPDSMRLPAPLSIVSYTLRPFVWLHMWTSSMWPVYMARTVIFIIDMIVHLTVGLPWILVLAWSPVWKDLKHQICHLGYVYFPFLWPLISVLVFFFVIWNSLKSVLSDTMSKSGKGKKYRLLSDDAGKQEYGAVDEQKDDVEAAAGWRHEMLKTLKECPLTEDENASGQMVGLMTKLDDRVAGLERSLGDRVAAALERSLGDRVAGLERSLGDRVAALEGTLEEVKALLQPQYPPK